MPLAHPLMPGSRLPLGLGPPGNQPTRPASPAALQKQALQGATGLSLPGPLQTGAARGGACPAHLSYLSYPSYPRAWSALTARAPSLTVTPALGSLDIQEMLPLSLCPPPDTPASPTPTRAKEVAGGQPGPLQEGVAGREFKTVTSS